MVRLIRRFFLAAVAVPLIATGIRKPVDVWSSATGSPARHPELVRG